VDPLAINESRSNLSSESGRSNQITENSKKFNEALIQMGVAKADNELQRFFTWIQKSDTPSLKSLLQWKANRSIVEFNEEDSLLNNNDTVDILEDPNGFEITENSNETENININEDNNENKENKMKIENVVS